MPKRQRKRANMPSLNVWATLGVQAGEMMLASAQVISHRVGRMATASFPLNPRDSTEFMRMGQEKIAAATESIIAVSTGVMTGQSPQTLARKGLKPYHSRAVANAKRLGKFKP